MTTSTTKKACNKSINNKMPKIEAQPTRPYKELNPLGRFKSFIVQLREGSSAICDVLESKELMALIELGMMVGEKAYEKIMVNEEMLKKNPETSIELEKSICAFCKQDFNGQRVYSGELAFCSNECSNNHDIKRQG